MRLNVVALTSIVIGFGSIIAGVILLGGLPWGFIVGGVLAIALGILLYDPKVRRTPKSSQSAPTIGQRPKLVGSP